MSSPAGCVYGIRYPNDPEHRDDHPGAKENHRNTHHAPAYCGGEAARQSNVGPNQASAMTPAPAPAPVYGLGVDGGSGDESTDEARCRATADGVRVASHW